MSLFTRGKEAFNLMFNFGVGFEDGRGERAPAENDAIKNLSIENSFVAAVSKSFRYGVIPSQTNIQFNSFSQEFNKKMENIVYAWSKRGNCEVTGDYYRGSAEQTMIDQYSVKSGGYLLRHHYSKLFPFGYMFEILALASIDTDKTDTEGKIKNGFEFNRFARITHIHLRRDNKESERVPMSKLTLVVDKWADPHQRSGLSQLRPVMEGLEYIDAYREAELKGMKEIADNPHFIKTKYFQDIIQAKKREAGRAKEGLTADELTQIFSQRRLDVGSKVDRFTYLDIDEEVTSPNEHKQSVYGDLFDKEYGITSAGVGLTSMSTTGAMPSSYNAALKGQGWEERVYESVLEQNVELAWEDMVTDRLIEGLILKGMCPVDDYEERKWEYRHVDFIRKSLPHIDPLKAAKATTANLKDNKTGTMPEELRKKGKDPEKYLREKYEYKMMKKRIKKELKEQGEKE